MSERVYSSAQVAKLLGVSGGMLRRYALAYEELAGERIPQHPRDGRQFSQTHVDALVSARRFVVGRQGLSVEAGLRMALGLAELPPATSATAGVEVEGLATTGAFREALEAYAGPLLTQLQTLNTTNERLANEVAELRRELAERPQIALEASEGREHGERTESPPEALGASRGGFGERLGRRFDGLLRRFRSQG